jgi:hypothetical protein
VLRLSYIIKDDHHHFSNKTKKIILAFSVAARKRRISRVIANAHIFKGWIGFLPFSLKTSENVFFSRVEISLVTTNKALKQLYFSNAELKFI